MAFDPSSKALSLSCPLSQQQWLICGLAALDPTLSSLICSYSFGRELPHVHEGENPVTGQLQELQPSFIHDQVLRHRPPGFSLGGLCVLFQSSKLLGLGSPLSVDHSATLMATWTLKFYSKLPRRSGRWGWRKCLPGLALHCRGSLCHSSVTQKTSSSACVTMAFRSLEHNDCWLTWMHSILIEPELIWGFLCVFHRVGKEAHQSCPETMTKCSSRLPLFLFFLLSFFFFFFSHCRHYGAHWSQTHSVPVNEHSLSLSTLRANIMSLTSSS